MRREIIKNQHLSFCKNSNANMLIQIEYIKSQPVGKADPQYQKGSFTCKNISRCRYAKDCPVYRSAPMIPRSVLKENKNT